MSEGDVYTPQQIANLWKSFPEGTRFRQEAPMLRFYVRWDLQTWEQDAAWIVNTYQGGSAVVQGRFTSVPGGTVVVEAPSLAEAQGIASYDSESLMDYDFLANVPRGSANGYESYPQPFTDAELDAIGEGRCFFRVTSVVPAALDDGSEGSR